MKAMIVINLPKGTKPKDFTVDLRLYHKTLDTSYIFFIDEVNLKTIPRKKEFSEDLNDFQKGTKTGWNECIDKLVGVKK